MPCFAPPSFIPTRHKLEQTPLLAPRCPWNQGQRIHWSHQKPSASCPAPYPPHCQVQEGGRRWVHSLPTPRPFSGVLKNVIVPSRNELPVHLPPSLSSLKIPTLKFPACASPQCLLLPHHTIWSLVRSAFSLASYPTWHVSPFPPQGQEDCRISQKPSRYGTHGTSLPRSVVFPNIYLSRAPLLKHENPI